MIYLVRHAHAGDKQNWPGPDELRPLSATGEREATGLVTRLRPLPVAAIRSSPALRCTQTVGALADQRRLTVTGDNRLGVHAAADAALPLVLGRRTIGGLVLCTHGELIRRILDELRDRGAPISWSAEWPKGSTWVLRTAHGRVVGAEYIPPLRAAKTRLSLGS